MHNQQDFFDEEGRAQWCYTTPEGTVAHTLETVLNWAEYVRNVSNTYLYTKVVVLTPQPYEAVVREIYYPFGGNARFLVVAPNHRPQIVGLQDLRKERTSEPTS